MDSEQINKELARLARNIHRLRDSQNANQIEISNFITQMTERVKWVDFEREEMREQLENLKRCIDGDGTKANPGIDSRLQHVEIAVSETTKIKWYIVAATIAVLVGAFWKVLKDIGG